MLIFSRSLGGATATVPAAGFDNGDLGVYFGQKASVAVRSPTRAIPNATSAPSDTSAAKLPIGAIVGIAIGGVLVLLALLLGGCCFIRRHRKKKSQPLTAEVACNPAPTYTQSQFTPHTPQTPYENGQHTQTQHYQLPANEPPAELSGNNYPLHQVDPKANMIQQVHDTPQYPPSPHHISPLPSPSPHPSTNAGTDYNGDQAHSPYGSQVSPTPTYSSLGRGARKAVPANQTYYSP